MPTSLHIKWHRVLLTKDSEWLSLVKIKWFTVDVIHYSRYRNAHVSQFRILCLEDFESPTEFRHGCEKLQQLKLFAVDLIIS